MLCDLPINIEFNQHKAMNKTYEQISIFNYYPNLITAATVTYINALS